MKQITTEGRGDAPAFHAACFKEVGMKHIAVRAPSGRVQGHGRGLAPHGHFEPQITRLNVDCMRFGRAPLLPSNVAVTLGLQRVAQQLVGSTQRMKPPQPKGSDRTCGRRSPSARRSTSAPNVSFELRWAVLRSDQVALEIEGGALWTRIAIEIRAAPMVQSLCSHSSPSPF